MQLRCNSTGVNAFNTGTSNQFNISFLLVFVGQSRQRGVYEQSAPPKPTSCRYDDGAWAGQHNKCNDDGGGGWAGYEYGGSWAGYKDYGGLATTIMVEVGLATTIMVGGLATTIMVEVGPTALIMLEVGQSTMIGVEARLATTIMVEVGLATVIMVEVVLATKIMVYGRLATLIMVETLATTMANLYGSIVAKLRGNQIIHQNHGGTESPNSQKQGSHQQRSL